MKKKILIVFSVIVLAVCLTFSLVACKHNHQWSAEWSSDNTYHWHNCEKKGCKQVTDVMEHTFTQGSDDSYHWQYCSVCKYIKDKVPHNFNQNFVCIDCGYVHTHTIEYNDEQHWYTCTNCNINKDKVSHTFVDGECSVCGYKQGTKGLMYSENPDGKSYTVTGMMRDDDISVNDIVIAEYHQGKPVTIIGKGAFSARLSLYSVYIPKSIVKIEESAFSDCQSLSEITIPQSVTTIERNVFANCYGITIKAQAKSRPNNWYTADWEIDQFSKYPIVWDCDNNKVADDGYAYVTVYLSSGEEVDKGKPIKYGLKNGEAMVARQPRRIVYNSSGGVDNLFEIKRVHPVVEYGGVKYNVTAIGDYAFFGFDNIKTFEVPIHCKQIGAYAFANCIQLQTITWRSNAEIEKIDICAFADCINLEYAKGVNDIQLTEFILPDTVTSIMAGAFSGCVSIKKITLSKNISYVGDGVFIGCSKLIVRCEEKSKPQGWGAEWNNANRPVIWNCTSGGNTTEDGKIIFERSMDVYILDPVSKTAKLIYQDLLDSTAHISSTVTYVNENDISETYTVTTIGENAFANNTEITTIKLSENIKTIESGAFFGCASLETIIYAGSEAQWNQIEFGTDWDKNAGNYKIEYSR